MMILLLGTGIWLTLGTRVVQGRHFTHAWRLTRAGAFRPKDSSMETQETSHPFKR